MTVIEHNIVIQPRVDGSDYNMMKYPILCATEEPRVRWKLHDTQIKAWRHDDDDDDDDDDMMMMMMMIND